ncbi:CDP-glycerol glycerophosphotransferase family protein [Neobacillus thermocopriae]|uniref:CDP-glycerol glycerophosphotransferase family protein n=1 Tax=Neobacillus thermocopriae TaxID=1215031 RepID=UPI00377035E0
MRLKQLISLVKLCYKIVFVIIGFLPVKKRLIIFESYLGKQYSCNPKAIYEYLKANHPEYELLWSVDKKYSQPFMEKQIPYVKRFSLKWLWLLPRAEYWITNCRMPLWQKKPRHTTYIQTWHGTPLKKLGFDIEEVHMPGTTTVKYRQDFYAESRQWDLLISPNQYSTEIFRRAFRFEKEILETGYPRNDILIQKNQRESINRLKEKMGIPKDKKVILYAPTWRDNDYVEIGKYKFTLHLELEQMKRALGDEYVILLRLHYLISRNLDVSAYKGFVFESTNQDIQELYLVSDVLITDYSSVFFDYMCLKRPIIFFTYDLEIYRDKLRGFYFDFEQKAPGPLVKTTKEVIHEIKQLSGKEFTPTPEYMMFYEQFCSLEQGVSTARVVKGAILEREKK